MIKTSTKMLFGCTIIFSTLMVMSSSSWLNMWIGLEINLMSFIPMMFQAKNSFLSQGSMMYFLMQSMASIIFILSILLSKYMFVNIPHQNIMKHIITMAMMMKLGIPPFHMWFPELMSKLDWKMCFMLMTWQKIAPLYILSQVMENNLLIMTAIYLATMAGAILGLNQSSTRKIMAYSSINHLGWMMACSKMYKKSWLMYLLMYLLLTMMICILLNIYNIMFMNQFSLSSNKMSEKLMVMSMMMSMGGLPPFFGFMPKWMTIQYMISSKEMLMLVIMVLAALITLFYYLRMSSSMNLMLNHSQKWIIFHKNSMTYMYLMFMVNASLPLVVVLLSFA